MEINVYSQYFEAQGDFNGVERRGALVLLISGSEAGTISYRAAVSFFPHRDAEDFAVTSIMLTAKEGMRPDAVVYGVGPMHDGDTFLLCTDVPDVAAHYGVTYTIGDRTVTWAITCSGENGSVILVEL